MKVMIAIATILLFSAVHGWQLDSNLSDPSSATGSVSSKSPVGRRAAFADIVALGALSIVAPQPATASGGATAGGAYLLSAKQRYNDRVVCGVKAYLSLGSSIELGDTSSAKLFFTVDNTVVGGWADTAGAGYLLSNAFRRSSSTAPDSLPSVKKWKAFKAEVEALEKITKKKGGKGAAAAYKTSLPLLDSYLEAVELPDILEIMK